MKAAHSRRYRLLIHAALFFAFGIAAAACSVQKTVGGWFGATPSPTPVLTPQESSAAGVFYAGVDGLKVYSDSSSSAKIVGQLPLYDKVTRSKLERGYAYVTSAQSGVTGWVNNAQLLWRVPSPPPTAPGPPTAAPSEEAAPPAEEAVPPVVAPAPTATRREAPPTPAAGGLAPSIFDAY